MSALTQQAINEQEALIREVSEIESLIDVCRNNQFLQESAELSSVCDVLLAATDRLFQLREDQSGKLKQMNAAIESGELSGGAA